MNDVTLQGFRDLAEAMNGGQATDWQWIGRWPSQRLFGITQARAEGFAARHGGTASRMDANTQAASRFLKGAR